MAAAQGNKGLLGCACGATPIVVGVPWFREPEFIAAGEAIIGGILSS